MAFYGLQKEHKQIGAFFSKLTLCELARIDNKLRVNATTEMHSNLRSFKVILVNCNMSNSEKLLTNALQILWC